MKKNLHEVVEFVGELGVKYLAKHLAEHENHGADEVKEVDPETYDLDVRAYCVFVHAAIEQYFEELADFVLASLLKQWDSGLPMSRSSVVSLISIIISDGVPKLKIEDDESLEQPKPLHHVRELLENSRKTLTKKFRDNHGASLKYLRGLFAPLGMAIDPSPNAESALSRLASSRGAFAHRRTMQRAGHYTYKPISPADAQKAATDCLELCHELLAQIPTSLTQDFYTAEGLHLSAYRAKLANVVKSLADQKLRTEPAKRLP